MTHSTTAEVARLFKDELADESFVIAKDGTKLVEVLGVSFIADAPAIFGVPNADYIKREIAWYNSESRYVDDIPGETPRIWSAIADDDGMINSNYGYLCYSSENHYQAESVLNTLLEDPTSRRAAMIYTRPSIQKDFCRNGMSDFICTHAVNYFIRHGCLHAIVQMRSNDVIFGYRNDYAWQRHIQEELVTDYNRESGSPDIGAGQIIWNAASLHVYERHFTLIK